ncbi:hypothetical protein C0Q70_02330 [Pomacea canaliculata]|uniref:3'-5' exonuclease domain-containing protein n=1 Tax=Pomacea canaliculata TaxID=400727 RepID=A0A2T7PPP4_POMCA|nr:uncharacterized protein LOC112558066 [Pomacea canaliculata]PVD35370.1 hypothetical protein C0Q70_02330 [Pomacea canaliculata]
MATRQPQIVNSLTDCERALQDLKREPYLAVDGEGVHLSKTGPLTLLQIGTKEGQVYLFDVLTEPRMLKTGGLKSILESDTIVKVIHSSTNDAEALYWQFGLKLHNVFDTQLAHMELQRAEGRRYPSRMKLAEACEVYCPQKAALLQEKEQVQTQWSKLEGSFWAKRPLTPEMIKYASHDVLVLIPEVYSAMKSLVESKGLTRQLNERTREDIEATMDKQVKDRMEKNEQALVLQILRDFAKTSRPPDRLSDIKDEDVLIAISKLPCDSTKVEGLPSNIQSLKIQSLRSKVEEVEKELNEKGEHIAPGSHMFGLLNVIIRHSGDFVLKDLAQKIQNRLDAIALRDMEKKYDRQTPIQHVAEFEKRLLSRCLRPKGENDPTVNPVVLRLYWLHQEESVDTSVQQSTENPGAFQINEGYTKKLRFYLSSPEVPFRLKAKAKNFLERLQAVGKVQRPPPRRGRATRRFNVRDYDDDDDYYDDTFRD